MEHDVSLISTLAAAFGVAMVLGFLAERVKIPALVGYLLAGVLIGPATPGFVADAQIAAQLFLPRIPTRCKRGRSALHL